MRKIISSEKVFCWTSNKGCRVEVPVSKDVDDEASGTEDTCGLKVWDSLLAASDGIKRQFFQPRQKVRAHINMYTK